MELIPLIIFSLLKIKKLLLVPCCQKIDLVLSLFKNILKYRYAKDKVVDISNELGCYFGSNGLFVVFVIFYNEKIF